MTVSGYCQLLGWNTPTLARQAGIDYKTAQKAMEGKTISSRAATSIAEAFSEATGRKIYAGDIEGLNIR